MYCYFSKYLFHNCLLSAAGAASTHRREKVRVPALLDHVVPAEDDVLSQSKEGKLDNAHGRDNPLGKEEGAVGWDVWAGHVVVARCLIVGAETGDPVQDKGKVGTRRLKGNLVVDLA